MGTTTVRFLESSAGSLAQLEIETPRGLGFFAHITRALYALEVQIVRAESRVENGRRLERLFLVELDGTPIVSARRLEIQVGVLRAVGTLNNPRPELLRRPQLRRRPRVDQAPPAA
ncbi:MAG: hypothetical protein IPI67_22040 [Myxococcales bacterium]|nr:hypothetical protein [Myxococcales bacterium]